jgi:poly-gamma-glutamate synthesis protein (capsule biosynthesis protein)
MPGINLVERLSEEAVHNIANKVRPLKRQGDIVIASIHWGSNWGYQVPFEEVDFAHNLINHAGVDLVYGHSSHHVKGIEVYGNKLILYGCGDFLDDYEGIRGFGEFRGDLGLMYFVEADPSTGNLIGLKMIPTQIRNFRVNRASNIDVAWLENTLNREGLAFGTRVEVETDNTFTLCWD